MSIEKLSELPTEKMMPFIRRHVGASDAGVVINATAARAAILALCKSRLFASILVLVSGRVMQNMRCISKGATNFKSLAFPCSAMSRLNLHGLFPVCIKCFPNQGAEAGANLTPSKPTPIPIGQGARVGES